MKLLVDMNLSLAWVPVFIQHGHAAVHWANVGDPRAADRELIAWALQHDYVVFTHDLDFGAILAATGATGPSVVQVRTQDILPAQLAGTVLQALTQFAPELEAGALITIDPVRVRARLHIVPRHGAEVTTARLDRNAAQAV